ncbi:hypothetical protein BpHYR1_043477 [Brachionus plicatilis]|uniref:Uncharacterized protein n=1 Tax=Brachionus plicatilis TaxID=10195 RepID=A0A3M7P607_BRAPC|nr:hypothetical protein BpHYR1_043477 [Brachionus plicatilis]
MTILFLPSVSFPFRIIRTANNGDTRQKNKQFRVIKHSCYQECTYGHDNKWYYGVGQQVNPLEYRIQKLVVQGVLFRTTYAGGCFGGAVSL